MNGLLSQFVEETEAQYAGRLRKPEELFRKEYSSEELLDVAVLSGYSISDILSGKVANTDIDPRILAAFGKQYPHAGDFVGFIRSHEGHTAEINGIISAVKGKLFELEYVDLLNHGHLPVGAVAELAVGPTQPDWDIIIKDANGHPIEYLQLKATESIGYIKEAFTAHPEIDVVATHEIFARINELNGSDLHQHLIDGQFFNENLDEQVRNGIDTVNLTPEFHFPLIAFGMIAIQSVKSYADGRMSATEAIRSGATRGWRTLLCRAAAYASILISHEPVIGLPTSVLTRLTFSRHDVQKRGLELLKGLTTGLRHKHLDLQSRHLPISN